MCCTLWFCHWIYLNRPSKEFRIELRYQNEFIARTPLSQAMCQYMYAVIGKKFVRMTFNTHFITSHIHYEITYIHTIYIYYILQYILLTIKNIKFLQKISFQLNSQMKAEHCTVYSVQCTVYSVQCAVYSVQCVQDSDESNCALSGAELIHSGHCLRQR